MSDDVIVINQGYETRTSASGKQRVTITVKSEPVIVNTDPKALGKPIALAIAHHYRERIKAITAQAAPATIKARKVAAKAFAEGKAWAQKRYAGGRMGAMPPHQSDKAFNDSERFANSVTANASSDGNWRVNVAANRLSSETSGGVERVFRRLVELVPEIGNPALLLENNVLKKAIENAMASAITKAEARTSALTMSLVRAVIGLGEQVGEVLEGG